VPGDAPHQEQIASLRARVAALSRELEAATAREAELRESEARFRILAEESLVGVYVIQDHRFAYVNEPGARLFGLSRQAVVGRDFAALVAPESLPVVEENVRRRLAGEISSMRYCLKVRHHSGETRDCEVLGSAAVWAGRPAIIGTAIDRTDELQAQAQLAEQKRILELILDCMGDGVAVTDSSGEFIIFNPAARRITGLGPMGRTPQEWSAAYGVFTADGATLFPPQDLPLARAMQGEATDGIELFLRNPRTPDGVWVRVTGRPLVDEDGAMHGGVVVFHDTTDRRRMFEQLQRAEARYRALVEHLPVVAYTAQPDGRVFYVSPQVEPVLGFTPADWVADPELWARQLHADDRDRVIAEARRCRQTGDKLVCEYRIHARDGRVVWLHDEAVVLRDEHGRPATVQGLLLDVTEREAERSVRLRLLALSKDLVAVQESERRRIGLELHDDIGQVLTGLRLQLAALRRLPPRKVAGALADAEQLVDEATGRVRALSQSLRPAVLDDLGLLPALVSHVDRWSRQTGIRVDLEHRGIERRRFDPDAETAAYRIVQEALTNVARHAGVGTARVRATADDGALYVEIEDPGVGFDVSSVSPNGAMHGLGGMRERMALLGGSLSVESLPGRGCRLTAEIPLRGATEPS
jgi:two-component system sensor histidine kinase UhpB